LIIKEIKILEIYEIKIYKICFCFKITKVHIVLKINLFYVYILSLQ
jgi:hypothetical protein